MTPLPAVFETLLADLHARRDEERAKEAECARRTLEWANRAVFERECAASGIDPTDGVSPGLAKLLADSRGGATK